MQLLDELKKPFNLLNVAIAVGSLLLSVYFYFESRQKREPVFIAHTTSQIFNKSNATPKLRLLDQAGKPIGGDVHVLEVSFWNHGRQPIEAVDIRTPVFIEFPSKTQILEYSVVRQNKPEITALRLIDSTSQQIDRPRVGIQWSHLDPGLGARLQFIYVGDKNPPISFGGDILDAEIENGASPLDRIGGAAATSFLAALVGVLSTEIFKSSKKRVQVDLPKWRRRLTIALLSLIVYGTAFLIFWLIFIGKSAPV